MQKLGILASVVACIGDIWDNVVHLLKTIYGISDVTHDNKPEAHLYSPRQASMCGPLFWLICYWVIVESIDPCTSGIKFYSAFAKISM
jgi:hypothetical protein